MPQGANTWSYSNTPDQAAAVGRARGRSPSPGERGHVRGHARLGNQVPDAEQRLYILRQAHYEAIRNDLPPEMVLAVIDIESAFDPYAVSVAGAQGLMQVMPFWLDEIGHPEDNLIDMHTNLRMGCTILKYYMDMEKNNLRGALARYNGSYGDIKHTYSTKVLDALRLRWHQK